MRYRMKYRPPGFATLPSGLGWNWVALPSTHRHLASLEMYRDMPVSDWPHGIIKTSRPLTEQELADFEIEVVP